MAERSGIEQIVERVVAQVLESHSAQAREEIARRVMGELQPHLGSTPEASPANLLKAVLAIHGVTAQRDVLRALLDNAVRYCGRTALFVVKSGAAAGWQGRAFGENDAIKDFALDTGSGLVARALQGRITVSGSASEMDHKFIAQFGAPHGGQCLLLPLMLKEKVAALIYADDGAEAGGHLDSSALELLVISTGAWLEVTSLRKSAPKEGAQEPGVPTEKGEAKHVAAAHAATSFADPFAVHAPKHAPPVPAAPVTAEPEAAAGETETAAAAAGAPDPFAGMPPEDADVHRKAQRFARLLVDEIKLYNQAKVSEGRKNKDLYDRLKEDIDKSRSSFRKRYGNTVAASADYFNQEIIRSLAEDDESLLGGNFKR